VVRLATHRAAALALGGLTAVLTVEAVEYTVGLGSPALDGFARDYLYDVLIVAAGLVCAARAFVRGRESTAWLLIGLGLVSWATGDIYWTAVLRHLAEPPFPSLGDAFYLGIYPPVYVAIVLLLRTRLAEFPRSLWLDGFIGAVTIAAVGTAVVFDAVLGATEGSPAAVATNLTYPLGDLLLVALVVWSLGLTGWRPGRGWTLLAAGFVVFGVSDSVYLYQAAVGTYVEGTILDLGWLVAPVLLAWSAWQPLRARAAVRVDGIRFVVPPLASGLVAVAVLVYDHFAQINVLAVALAGTALVAVIARLALTFAENARMLSSSRREARTDALTGLGNRRSLLDDVEERLAAGDRFMLTLFDLDGFKQYNDTFGHPAGDRLLARLARNLDRFAGATGRAYRMGGDEFCLVVDDGHRTFEAIAATASDTLAERGDGFAITLSYGAVVVPDEATTAADALRIADQRMYAQKHGGRVSAGDQSSSVLVQAFAERDPCLADHLLQVADLAEAVARKLGLRPDEVRGVRIAAGLHDVGKVAIPDEILEKQGPLEPGEWDFVRRHTLIGEKILHAAPALAEVAALVRSSHERFDGTGYPDGLANEAIPIGSRIIFVCDAYHAMTSQRPYSPALGASDALVEVRRCAGTQFDPRVVDAFVAVLAERAVAQLAA
jgi:diguanylate cyclase (GGDEF)-like protein/putative nucleotidyltransferase with HDIG domain